MIGSRSSSSSNDITYSNLWRYLDALEVFYVIDYDEWYTASCFITNRVVDDIMAVSGDASSTWSKQYVPQI